MRAVRNAGRGLRDATLQVTYDALVLDAISRQSLATVRSLGSRGLRVAAVGTTGKEPTLSSRWCQQAFICPVEEGTDEYLHYLEQVFDCTGARVLITSSDGTIALIRRHRERLEQRVRIALAKEPALAIAINKRQTLEIAKQLGVHIPGVISVRTVDEVGAALREIGLPAVVKPVESWVGDEQQGIRLVSQLVTTADEARRAVEKLTRFGGTTLFQQFLPGRRESLTFLYAKGEFYARFAQWGKRVNPPLGGASVLGKSIALPPDITDQAERLVCEIDLEGVSHIEFRRDRSGVAYLMEINPRLALSTELAVRSGVDFPHLLYQWTSGEKIDRVTSYREGVWLRHLAGDIATTVAALEQRGRPGVSPPAKALFDFGVSFFRPTHYYSVDWKDPLPAWTATTGFIRDLPRLVRKHLPGRAEVPIGVFDSGAGGLTILSALRKELPYENYVYFGDTANCPYGLRSDADIVELSIRATRFLIEQRVKLIVVACNTASLTALKTLRTTFAVPFVGVVPAVRLAARASKKGRIGVAATYQAAQSIYLRQLIDECAEGKQVYTVGCPELVPLVERGECDGPVVEWVVRDALQPLLAYDVDVIVLGCTHFLALRSMIERVAGPEVQVIDNALAVAPYTHAVLDAEALLKPVRAAYPAYGELEVRCSGDPRAFSQAASNVLGYAVFAQQTQLEREPSGTIPTLRNFFRHVLPGSSQEVDDPAFLSVQRAPGTRSPTLQKYDD